MLLARLCSSWGTKGYIKASSESGCLEHLLALREVFVGLIREEALRCEIERVLIKGEKVLFKFKGFDSPECVRALSGHYVWAERVYATPLGEGEYYLSDLVGWRVLDTSGEVLGKVLGILHGARMPLLEVESSGKGIFLVPLCSPFVLQYKEDFQEIMVDKGLLL